MIKSIRNFLIIFFILQQLKSQISQFDKNGLIGFLRTNSSVVSKHLVCVVQHVHCIFRTYLQAKAGFVMNILCILVSNLSLHTLGVWVFDVKSFPAWANATAGSS